MDDISKSYESRIVSMYMRLIDEINREDYNPSADLLDISVKTRAALYDNDVPFNVRVAHSDIVDVVNRLCDRAIRLYALRAAKDLEESGLIKRL